ncbi:long-chain fatty acid--CoA ligase, partial [Streptomyces sp. 13-12-16]|uniref:AMP-binding protein n=1 Tax=Streptomyces sp. 13-12-16 TaxID=1570823 RepID=UPI000A244ABC
MTSAPRTTGDLPDDPAGRTLPQLLARNARAYPRLPGLSWQSADPDGDGDWTTLGWAEIHEHTRSLAAGYRALGVGCGDHVLLMMSNRPEHWLSDLALVRLGAVPVSVYGTAAPEQIIHIARNCRARLAVVEGAAQVAVWEPLLADAGTPLERLVVAEAG